MAQKLTVALVQNNAGLDFDKNLADLQRLVRIAAGDGADLIAMPEYCSHYGMVDGRLAVGAHPIDQHPGLNAFQNLAKEVQRAILVGSIGVKADDGRVQNCSILLDGQGGLCACYEKIHLFDVDLAGGESYRESNDIAPGSRAVIASLGDVKIGLSVCYDLRFPHLYRDLAKAGAHCLTIPAAFTAKTGKAHWHVLCRARAIETGCFVIAPSQYGSNPEGKLQRYGHSLVVAPWGEVLADGGDGEGVVSATIDLAEVAKTRSMVPALRHDRPYSIVSE